MRADVKKLPAYARAVLAELLRAGYTACYAGGCVRDLCISAEPQDVDIASSATPEEVMRLFPKTVPTGIAHGTVTVLMPEGSVEVTSFRREGTYTDGRHPDAVTFGATPREDAARRDFTVNALFMEADGRIVDYQNGLADLEKGIIRAVGNPEKRFEEDGLRMIRAYRFCAKTGFSLEENTEKAIGHLAWRMKMVAPERICAELLRLLSGPRPEWMNEVCRSGLLQHFGIHTGLSEKLQKALSEPGDGRGRLALLGAELEREGVIPGGEALLRALRCDGETEELCKKIGRVINRLPADRVEMKECLGIAGPEALFTALALSEDPTKDRNTLKEILSSGECWRTAMLSVSGRDIGRTGPECGRILRALTAHCIRHPEDNNREKLLLLAKKL